MRILFLGDVVGRSGRDAIVAALPGLLPPGWRLRLLPDHRIQVEQETAAVPTATGVIAAMVRFALALDPCLDRLEQVPFAGKRQDG